MCDHWMVCSVSASHHAYAQPAFPSGEHFTTAREQEDWSLPPTMFATTQWKDRTPRHHANAREAIEPLVSAWSALLRAFTFRNVRSENTAQVVWEHLSACSSLRLRGG